MGYAAAMAKRCDVLVCLDGDQLASEYAGRTVPAAVGRLRRLRFKTPLDLVRLVLEVRRFRPSIVHFQEAAGPRKALFNAVLAALTTHRAMIVLTVHDPLPHEGRDQSAAKRMAFARGYLRRRADIIVVHGAYCAKLLRDSAPTFRPALRPRTLRPRIAVSEHGLILEPARFGPAARSGPLRLYFFGRMEAYKGLDVLLAMAEMLHEDGVPFALAVAGRGPELDRLQERFQRLPELDVSNGFVPPAQVMAAIQAADCVLLPYLSATQSGVLAAAYAGRRYVVASRTGGIPDVVEHGVNGLLVPPGDPRALADAVRSLVRDQSLRGRLQAGAAATAQGRLSWDRIAAELQATFLAQVDQAGADQAGAVAGPRANKQSVSN